MTANTAMYEPPNLLQTDPLLLQGQIERWLKSSRLAGMPPEQLQRVVNALEVVPMATGDCIIRQGDPGEHYFVIGEGHCQVTRELAGRRPAHVIAKLVPGDAFGEEALIVTNRRSASVTALTAGVLLRLSRDVFDATLRRPLLRPIELDAAERLVGEPGGVWLDVRKPEETVAGMFDAALAIPLPHLRAIVGRLRRDRRYVVYCDKGLRSAVAAFLMSERGFDAQFLLGGLRRYGRLGAATPVNPALPTATDFLASTIPQALSRTVPLLDDDYFPDVDALLPESHKTWREAGESMLPIAPRRTAPVEPARFARLPPFALSVPHIHQDIAHFEEEQAALTTLRLRAGQILTAVEHLAKQREMVAAARLEQTAHTMRLFEEMDENLSDG